jgi:hypothetical protein
MGLALQMLGTYKPFIDAVNEIGPEYKDRIYREYLGIEPPADAFVESRWAAL